MMDKMRESLSALMDDEANELELERVLKHAGADDEVRKTWLRYNLARQARDGHQLAHLDWDISKRVRDALVDSRPDGVQGQNPGFGSRLLRPLVSFAVAASVAVTVVVGGQQLAGLGGADPYKQRQDFARSTAPVGLLNTLGATSVQAGYGLQPLPALQPMTRAAYQELAQQRLGKYMQEHAEQAALNSPQGLISYARVPQIRQ
jgi:sigma-E factor negative regulatory protein RseA